MVAITSRWRTALALALMGAVAFTIAQTSDNAEAKGGSRKARPGQMVMQTAGVGRLEGHPPGEVDGVRFEGRFVIWGLRDAKGAAFGTNTSLFDEKCVKKYGRGPQCAHFVGVRSGNLLQGFETNGDHDFVGQTMGRTSASSIYRIFYDAHPNGTRDFEKRSTFLRGKLVALFKSDEAFAIDPRGGVFDTRAEYTLVKSKPFTFHGRTFDFADIAPRMTELDHGHNPEPDPVPEQIPYKEKWFSNRGPGTFANRFPLGGTAIAVG